MGGTTLPPRDSVTLSRHVTSRQRHVTGVTILRAQKKRAKKRVDMQAAAAHCRLYLVRSHFLHTTVTNVTIPCQAYGEAVSWFGQAPSLICSTCFWPYTPPFLARGLSSPCHSVTVAVL